MGNQSDSMMMTPQYTTENSEPTFSLQAPPVEFQPLGPFPVDEEGYVQSFSTDDPGAIQAFFEKWGFVVVKNVLNDEEIQDAIEGFWNESGMDKNNPKTWDGFYKYQRFGHLGIIGLDSSFAPYLLKHRQNPNVYKGYSIVLNSDKLWVDHDRLGALRPTKNIIFDESSPPVDKPEWRTIDKWLHLDCNPQTGYTSISSFNHFNFTQIPVDLTKQLIIQSLITLTDARVEDGGFQCVPGSHKYTPSWSAKPEIVAIATKANIQVPKNDPIREHIQKIPIRKGCLLCWNSLTMHANHPNNSDRWRMVHYMRMVPTTGTTYSPKAPYPEAYKEITVTELGKKLFGLEIWE